LKLAWGKKNRLYLKKKDWCVVLVVEHLLSKCEALSSNSSIALKKRGTDPARLGM
jgi:hypothetical protein